MKKGPFASSPEAYLGELTGWRRRCVEDLRSAVLGAAAFDEVIKWGHLVYFANGPAVLIRAEDTRVLFGLWRGQRLLSLEPRLRPGGKYEMATLVLTEGDILSPETAASLAAKAAQLNAELGDPTRQTRA